MKTEEQIVARLLAGRLDKPPAPKPPPKPETKAQEHWAQPKPREAVAAHAAVSTEALAEQIKRDRRETAEDRRNRQYAKEMAEWSARDRYQRELDRWWQAKLDIEAEVRAMRESGEVPERGIYDPMTRFEGEMRGR